MDDSLVEWKRRKKLHAPDPLFETKIQTEQKTNRNSYSKEQNDSKWRARISYPGSDFNNMIILESVDCRIASGKQYFPIKDIKGECLLESSDKAKNGMIQPSIKRWR